MNEEKLYEVLNNQIQFSNDLMDLNIKYAEEIERLNKRIKKVLEMLDIILTICIVVIGGIILIKYVLPFIKSIFTKKSNKKKK